MSQINFHKHIIVNYFIELDFGEDFLICLKFVVDTYNLSQRAVRIFNLPK